MTEAIEKATKAVQKTRAVGSVQQAPRVAAQKTMEPDNLEHRTRQRSYGEAHSQYVE
jgi:hypothetical protein